MLYMALSSEFFNTLKFSYRCRRQFQLQYDQLNIHFTMSVQSLWSNSSLIMNEIQCHVDFGSNKVFPHNYQLKTIWISLQNNRTSLEARGNEVSTIGLTSKTTDQLLNRPHLTPPCESNQSTDISMLATSKNIKSLLPDKLPIYFWICYRSKMAYYHNLT